MLVILFLLWEMLISFRRVRSRRGIKLKMWGVRGPPERSRVDADPRSDEGEQG